MASSGKKKTTMAKLARESKLREKRAIKMARKEARKNAPPEDPFGSPVSLEDYIDPEDTVGEAADTIKIDAQRRSAPADAAELERAAHA
jgi:hypothetical protein